MAKGNVKKGFASYLLILFIAIIAAFFIIITIMLFSPFKNILGFKYFIYKNSTSVQEIGLEKTKLDFSTIENVSIDCGFTNIAIERSQKYDKYTILIDNRSSGFARSDQNTDFNYDINFSNTEKTSLNISVREPEGFLYFSKNIKVTLLAPIKNDISFENTNININNSKGTIYIGTDDPVVGSNSPSEADKLDSHNYVNFKSLNIKSTNNKIIFFKYANGNGDLFIKTNKGNIEVRRELNLKKFTLYATKAKLQFNELTIDNAILDIGDSEFKSKLFNVVNLDLNVNNGILSINKLSGTLSSNNMTSDMNKATIKIDKVEGFVSIPNANKAKIQINEVATNSQVYIRGTSSEINIGNAKANSYLLLETTSGNINATVTGENNIDIRSNKGKINLVYNTDSISESGINLYNVSGEINVKVKNTLAYILEVYDTNKTLRNSNNVHVAGYDGDFVIPLKVNNGTRKINVTSNGKVNVNHL